MTLCIGWIRQAKDNQELVIATDSCLTGGGEVWKHGIKLFELPRKDCLLCFAGDTDKAYPLIINLVSNIQFDTKIMNHHADLRQVLDYIIEMFTELMNNLDYQLGDIKEDYNPFTRARFIFGGWNWKLKLLEFWEIYYSMEERRFLYRGYDSNQPRSFLMIGDHLEEAEALLMDELTRSQKRITGAFDMEPFMVLSRMARDNQYRPIDGALQVAKVYQSGSTEFFGVMWQSLNGRHTFLGRELNPYIKPQIRFIDPDSGIILENEIPGDISNLELQDFGTEEEFLRNCYPGNTLKPDLSDKEKEMILAIFKDNAFKRFKDNLIKEPEPQESQENTDGQ